MSRYWVVIPAAGAGKRMGVPLAKQYMQIQQKPLIEYTIAIFSPLNIIEKIIVPISADDSDWQEIKKHDKVVTVTGGKERSDSVLNALKYLKTCADDDDWVLVHDAARPCLASSDIEAFIETLANHPIGGILAQPVRDTMKVSDDAGQIKNTFDRNNLWHAQTPQMFRLGRLYQALNNAFKQNISITDEAQAMELMGDYGQLVEAKKANIKVTYRQDFAMAVYYLERAK